MSVASKVTIGGISSNPLLSTPEARKGEEIITEARRDIESAQHIFSIAELGRSFTHEETVNGEAFKKYGARFFKSLKHSICSTTLRQAAHRLVGKKIEINNYDKAILFLALAKMGFGGGSEMAAAVGVKAKKAGLSEIFSLKFKNAENDEIAHTFVVFGKGVDAEINTNLPAYLKTHIDVLAFIEKIKSGIILDACVLKKPIAARDVRHCPEFVASIKAQSLDQIAAIDRFNKNPEELDEFLKEAEKLKARIIELLPTIPPGPAYAKVLLENEPAVCAEVLENRIPNTKWSKNAEKQKIWFEGTKEKATEIFEYLKVHCIKASEPALAKSGNWVVIISNPYFDQIESLPSFEKWKNKKKSEEKKSPEETPNGAASCALALGNYIPGTKWKKNETKKLVWFEGTKEKATEIRRYLKLHCIQATRKRVEKSDNFVVMLTDPDLELIEKLPSYDLWNTKQIVFASSLPKDEDE